jgi:hypothetical protein
LAQDGARVRVSSCGKGLCATIASTKSRIDPTTGASWTDKNNADPEKRNLPLVGVEVLGSMTQDGPGKWSGWLCNTDNGQTYTGHLIEIDALLVSGCSQIIDYHYSKSDFTTQSFDADISQCKRQNTSADSLELRTQERDDTMVHQCMTAKGYTITTKTK